MKKDYFGIIYKATFSNGKCYIGQTTRGLASRKRDHINSAGSENVAFHNAINKYGKENLIWEVIDTANSIEELNSKEIYWINYYNTYIHSENTNGYNMSLGGSSTLGWIPSAETKKKISDSHVGIHVGNKNPQFGKTRELSTWWGRKHTKEEKIKISDSNKGKILSDETKEKLRIANSGENSWRTKLSNSIVKNIKLVLKNKEHTQKEIAEMFNTTLKVITDINTGRTWKNIVISEDGDLNEL